MIFSVHAAARWVPRRARGAHRVQAGDDAIKHLRAWGWAHRDVKPEHLVISHAPAAAATALAPPSVAQLHIRLVDFGEACHCSSGYTTMYGFHGTPLYMAPEVAAWYGFDVNDHDAVHPPRYGTACDLWSLGMTLYVMLTGEAPWDQDSPDLGVLVAAIQGGQPKLASRAWDKVSEGAKALRAHSLFNSHSAALVPLKHVRIHGLLKPSIRRP